MKLTIKVVLWIALLAASVFADGEMGTGGYTTNGEMGTGGKTCSGTCITETQPTDGDLGKAEEDSLLIYLQSYLDSLLNLV